MHPANRSGVVVVVNKDVHLWPTKSIRLPNQAHIRSVFCPHSRTRHMRCHQAHQKKAMMIITPKMKIFIPTKRWETVHRTTTEFQTDVILIVIRKCNMWIMYILVVLIAPETFALNVVAKTVHYTTKGKSLSHLRLTAKIWAMQSRALNFRTRSRSPAQTRTLNTLIRTPYTLDPLLKKFRINILYSFSRLFLFLFCAIIVYTI